MRFKHVTVVGVGLIGGSFALGLRRAGLADRITGWDRKEVLDQACERGVIDGVANWIDSRETGGADFVYLAAPVGGILEFLRTRGRLIKPGAIVTDAGSTKRQICRVARESLPREAAFVGGHPMAGSERTGVEFAAADLFRGAAYALIEEEGTDAGALNVVSEVANALGARPIRMTAEQHDRIAARVSHAPQMLSTALALAIERRAENGAAHLAGSGCAEMTRLAESSWSVWQDICRTNSDEIAGALDEAISEIEALRVAISSGDSSSLKEMFEEAGVLARRISTARKKG